ncbi:hypothetical protein Zmor_017940 [Zophobas morio]|uniref:Uncharacterized protein n=1 Tax=Zophobas morio TaxID=2755281 RepID=A0AA38MDF6_9CUCU|nr:hypothetical protein Zmor_017940 [Zophobas morio]
MSVYEKSCPLKKEGLGKGTPWWNRSLSLLQSGLRNHFDRAKNTKKTEDWVAYKDHRKEFKKELRKRKREMWRSFCRLYSHLRRVSRTFAADHVSMQHKDYLPCQKGCSRYSTFSEELGAGSKCRHGGKTGVGSGQLFPM